VTQYVHVGQRALAVEVSRTAAGFVAASGDFSAPGSSESEAVRALGYLLEEVVRRALDAELRRRRVVFISAA